MKKVNFKEFNSFNVVSKKDVGELLCFFTL